MNYTEDERKICKDTILGYSLKFSYLNSLYGSKHISKDMELIPLPLFGDESNYIFFDTVEEAEAVKKEIITKAEELKKKIDQIKYDDKNAPMLIRERLKEFKPLNIIKQIFIALNMGDEPWELDVVQVIKN